MKALDRAIFDPERALSRQAILERQARLDRLKNAQHPRCIMCGAMDGLGLGLRFQVQPDGSVVAPFPCREAFQSYPERLHGGVISALLDAAMTHALFSVGIVAVTAELNVRFIAPVRLNLGATIEARISRDNEPVYHLVSQLSQDQNIVSKGTAKFFATDALRLTA